MASPLTLMMPIIPGTDLMTLAAALKGQQAAIDEALSSIGTVHYARFLLLDRSTPNLQPSGAASDQLVLAVITEFDGSFNDYIGDFVAKIGGVFDAVLGFVVGGAAVKPVKDNPGAFLTFVTANDASQHFPNNGQPAPGTPAPPEANQGLYEAYPYTVQDIKAAGIPG